MNLRKLILSTLGFILLFNTAAAEDKAMLDKRQQAIVPIAAFTASGDMDNLAIALNAGLDAGLTINEIREVLIQMYAYAGFPRSLNGINAFIAVIDERKAAGKEDVIGRHSTPLPADYDSNEVGNQTRNTITKRDLTNNPSAYAQFAPVIDVYLKEHLFGDIFARDVLNYQARELATISALAAMQGTEAQLNSHLKVSLNVGLTTAQLDEFVTVLNAKVNPEPAEKAKVLLAKIKETQNETKE